MLLAIQSMLLAIQSMLLAIQSLHSSCALGLARCFVLVFTGARASPKLQQLAFAR